MTATISNQNVIHQLTPRQFHLFKMAYSILRHHAIDILEFQKQRSYGIQFWIGDVLNEMKQILRITGEDRYLLKLSDIVSVKYKVSEMAGWYDVNSKESIYMVWKAHQAVIDLLELLYSEILYDDSILCDNLDNYESTLES